MEFSKFKVYHLVTFTSTSIQQQQSPVEAIKRLEEVENVIGVWRQRVWLHLDNKELNILDYKTSETIEHFPIITVQKAEAVNYSNAYTNLLLFTVYLTKDSAEMHIFDCRSVNAMLIVNEINKWKKKCAESLPKMISTFPKFTEKRQELKTYTLINKGKNDETPESDHQSMQKSSANAKLNSNVKETVSVFNKIAIERQRKAKIEKANILTECKTVAELNAKPKELQPFRYF